MFESYDCLLVINWLENEKEGWFGLVTSVLVRPGEIAKYGFKFEII